MQPEDMVTLSFYRDLSPYKEDGSIMLVQHIDTQKLYIKKQISTHNLPQYAALQQLKVPGIPVIHHIIDAGDKTAVIIEDFVHGETLANRLSSGYRFSEQEVIEIILQLCRPLAALHKADPPLIHRDIKPANVIISADFKVTLIDFDAAKLYDTEKNQDTVLMGTVDYAAPEQFGFRQSDARTDIYALGILMNVLLTGNLPKDYTYNGNLTNIINKCIHIDPGKRYDSVEKLEKALNRHSGLKKETYTPSSSSKPQKRWTPPGFRTKTAWKSITAVLGYICLIWFAAISEFKGMGEVQTAMNRIAIVLWGLSIIAVFANYRGFADILPLSRSGHPVIKYSGRLFWSAVFMILALVLPDTLYNLFV